MLRSKSLTRGIAVAILACASLAAPAWAAERTVLESSSDNWRSSLQTFSKENFKHPAWGYAHSLRIYNLAKLLAQQDKKGIDDDVLFAAAMMHDIAAFPKWAVADKDHADRAVELLPALLETAGFPKAKIPSVLEVVRTHMFDRKPVSTEAIYLHDADALDWLGAVGAFRLIAIIEVGDAQPNAQAALGLLQQRLAQVPAGVASPAGKKEAKIRARSLKRFLEELRSMSGNLEQL
ncbi:MAG: HD domain-containing protein [Sphingomonadaceae bacterium]